MHRLVIATALPIFALAAPAQAQVLTGGRMEQGRDVPGSIRTLGANDVEALPALKNQLLLETCQTDRVVGLARQVRGDYDRLSRGEGGASPGTLLSQLADMRMTLDAVEKLEVCKPPQPDIWDTPGNTAGVGKLGWYGSIGAGMAFVTGQKAPAGIGSLGLEASAGAAFSVAIGHDFGTIRAEMEVDWWKNNLRFTRLGGPTIFGVESPGTGDRPVFISSPSSSFPDLLPSQNRIRTDVATPPVANVVANGSQSELRLMFNLLLDIGDNEGISGHIGGGIGLARTTLNIGQPLLGQPFAPGSDSSTDFAAQVTAGVDIPIDDDISIGIGATYDLGGATIGGSVADGLSKGNVVADLGLSFSF